MTKQQIHENILDWTGPIGPCTSDPLNFNSRVDAYIKANALEGNEDDLEILLSLYIKPPKDLFDDQTNQEYKDYVELWLESWGFLLCY